MRKLTVSKESWPLKETFVISRMVQESGEVAVVEIEEDGHKGRGECDCSDSFDPSRPAVIEQIETQRQAIEQGLDRQGLLSALPAGPARNALDCALWDLEAKRAGRPAWELAGLAHLKAVTTVFTIGLGTAEKMAAAATANRDRPILKLKLGRPGDVERVAAVRAAAPEARLSVDANMAWTPEELERYFAPMAALGVDLIEQPLPRGGDEALADMARPVPVAADESCLDRSSLDELAGRYDLVNIKLDKTGGLTEALLLADAAEAAGFGIMVGCNIGTSLAMAPAMLIAQRARFVDLDGPLLLAKDREPGLRFTGSEIAPPEPALWG
jgi:L-alanine-DL-glutamate epimerase-like enolase superfamily enzyme